MDSCRVPIRQFPDPIVDTPLASQPVEKTTVLAGGCFWCVEAVFRDPRGGISVRNGYAGDSQATANYRTGCSGRTNHAEAIEIRYDPSPTTLGHTLTIHFSVAPHPSHMK